MVRRWLQRAAADLRAVEEGSAFLAEVTFPNRHDLDALRELLPPEWKAARNIEDLDVLTPWATLSRYPGPWPDPTDAQANEAAAKARQAMDAVLSDLHARGFETQDRPR
jgi:HEPN domain-containing protein